jgi:hypothetical protein
MQEFLSIPIPSKNVYNEYFLKDCLWFGGRGVFVFGFGSLSRLLLFSPGCLHFLSAVTSGLCHDARVERQFNGP